jgi:hypothetical protein
VPPKTKAALSGRLILTLWALMATDDLATAQNSLLMREGINKNKFDAWIGSITVNEEVTGMMKQTIKKLGSRFKSDAVILDRPSWKG